VAESTPPKTWPESGAIEFTDLVMSYRPGLPPVLRGVSLHVRGGEKIGVVGRTGAGEWS
jgi:ATP-binding cassette subfamily C (CFTR/MRP) protein 1